MTPAGVVTLLHGFAGAADENNPYGILVQGRQPLWHGGDRRQRQPRRDLQTETGSTPAAPVALSSTATTVLPSGAFTLTYSVANGYTGTTNGTNAGSGSLGYCFASNTAGDATWAGAIAGSPTAASSSSLTAPSTAGTYTYSLTCGGMESNVVMLTVQAIPPPVITFL